MMMDETRKVEHFVIRRYRIIGTDMVVYRAWEPSSMMGNHSTVTHFRDDCYGDVRSRNLPKWMDELPRGDERIRIVREWRDAQENQAYDLIEKAFPESASGRRTMGEIVIMDALEVRS